MLEGNNDNGEEKQCYSDAQSHARRTGECIASTTQELVPNNRIRAARCVLQGSRNGVFHSFSLSAGNVLQSRRQVAREASGENRAEHGNA
ncbi:hypothetical protein KSD_04350 [Ktedonobacter sp. SOSP1-85]|nr:hypothetical protein KSD_04350 [Ktedonobacter sp. SOSP1-85]